MNVIKVMKIEKKKSRNEDRQVKRDLEGEATIGFCSDKENGMSDPFS